MNRSACCALMTCRAPSRHQRVSRKSSISEGISGRGLTAASCAILSGMIRRAALTVAILFAIVAPNAAAVAPFPAYMTLPAGISVVDHNGDVDETYGEANMPVADADNIKRGHHVSARLQFEGVEND